MAGIGNVMFVYSWRKWAKNREIFTLFRILLLNERVLNSNIAFINIALFWWIIPCTRNYKYSFIKFLFLHFNRNSTVRSRRTYTTVETVFVHWTVRHRLILNLKQIVPHYAQSRGFHGVVGLFFILLLKCSIKITGIPQNEINSERVALMGSLSTHFYTKIRPSLLIFKQIFLTILTVLWWFFFIVLLECNI